MPRARDDSSRRPSRRPSAYGQMKAVEALAQGATPSKAAALAGTSRGAMRRQLASDPVLQLEVRVVRAERDGDVEAAIEVRNGAERLRSSGRAMRNPRVVQILLNTIVQQAERVIARREPKARTRQAEGLTEHLAELSEEERATYASLAAT